MKHKLTTLAVALLFISNYVFAQFSLNINFSNMSPHLGQHFEIRITDQEDEQEVAKQVLHSIDSDSFSLDFIALRTGRSYNVDFFADHNNNGIYDAPPIDHAWRITIDNVTSDQIVEFVHNTTFTDVGWPDLELVSYFETNWAGEWHDYTFDVTADIDINILIVCDSFHISMETSGLLGDPAIVLLDFSDLLPVNLGSSTDTLIFPVDTIVSGEIVAINGHISANLSHNTFPVGVQMHGNYGRGQVMGLFIITDFLGNPFANGYFYVRQAEVIDSKPIVEFSSVSIIDVSCAGADDGSVSLLASGGFSPYTYLWTDDVTGANRDSLAPGQYMVMLTDSLGCIADTIINVNEPDAIEIITSGTDETAPNANDGTASVTVNGGTPPYLYLWSTGATSKTIHDLSSGAYNVTVTDANGCEVQGSAEVHPFVCDLNIDSLAVANETNSSANGSIVAVISGGTIPYTYEWEKDNVFFSSMKDISGLSGGLYMLSVEDSVGCIVVSDTIELMNVTGITDLTKMFNIYPNPATSQLSFSADFKWFVRIYNSAGLEVLNTSYKENSGVIVIEDFQSGMYFLLISNGEQIGSKKLVIVD